METQVWYHKNFIKLKKKKKKKTPFLELEPLQSKKGFKIFDR